MDPEAFEREVRLHDQAVSAAGHQIWLGSEPTFTARLSAAPEWLGAALGSEKEDRARALVTLLAELRPRAVLMRSLGRKYPGEDHPRFCYGLLSNRDGSFMWNGPPDPLLADLDHSSHTASEPAVRALRDSIAARLRERGWGGVCLDTEDPQWARVVLCPDASKHDTLANDPDLRRASLHTTKLREKNPSDELALREVFLLTLGLETHEDGSQDVRLELPAFRDPTMFRLVLREIGECARAQALPTLILAGFGPPTDPSLEWTTVTPDPGVVEINMAPCIDVREFLREQRAIYAAAERIGLHPFRLYYNGDQTDSGGGGHLTFGGPSLDDSPFFVIPQLLPRMIAYFMQHPSLSYFFASASVGSSSQSPRVDESAPENLGELSLALHMLAKRPEPTPTVIWQTLAPLLTDRFGNSHRAELNVEKLCNPYLPGRGQLGVVELRALRMMQTPEHATAVAILLRAVLAWLSGQRMTPSVIDWGAELHDRFALPFYLERDLRAVLSDLEHSPFAIGEQTAMRLHELGPLDWVWLELPDARFRVRQALEFWPLVGDISSQEGTSRWLDSSSGRIELSLHARDAEGANRYTVAVDGCRVPMRTEATAQGAALVFGIRYRRFVPSPGLHPLLPEHGPLIIDVTHPRHPGYHLELHSWRPDGSGYAGLPADMGEAAARRTERVIVQNLDPQEPRHLREAPAQSLTPHSFDTRYL